MCFLSLSLSVLCLLGHLTYKQYVQCHKYLVLQFCITDRVCVVLIFLTLQGCKYSGTQQVLHLTNIWATTWNFA